MIGDQVGSALAVYRSSLAMLGKKEGKTQPNSIPFPFYLLFILCLFFWQIMLSRLLTKSHYRIRICIEVKCWALQRIPIATNELIEGNTKCRNLKKLTCIGTLRQVFI
jgi:hypothetical protein